MAVEAVELVLAHDHAEPPAREFVCERGRGKRSRKRENPENHCLTHRRSSWLTYVKHSRSSGGKKRALVTFYGGLLPRFVRSASSQSGSGHRSGSSPGIRGWPSRRDWPPSRP